MHFNIVSIQFQIKRATRNIVIAQGCLLNTPIPPCLIKLFCHFRDNIPKLYFRFHVKPHFSRNPSYWKNLKTSASWVKLGAPIYDPNSSRLIFMWNNYYEYFSKLILAENDRYEKCRLRLSKKTCNLLFIVVINLIYLSMWLWKGFQIFMQARPQQAIRFKLRIISDIELKLSFLRLM